MNPQTIGWVVQSKPLAEELQASVQKFPVRIAFEVTTLSTVGALVAKVEDVRPDILVIEVAPLVNMMPELFRQLKAGSAAPAIVAVHAAADPDLIVAAMRAGAIEFLYPPFSDKLPSAVEHIASVRGDSAVSSDRGGKAVGFFSAKGGCGATTIACHLALEFQRQTQHKLLLADFDIDAGLVKFLMKSKSSYSVLDAITNVRRLDFNFWKKLVSNGLPRLEVIGSPGAVSASDGVDVSSFRHVVRFARSHYDWIFADLGRSLNAVAMSALEEIDHAFLVTTLEVPALYHAKHLIRILLDGGYGRGRLQVLVNRMPKRPEVTLEEVEKILGLPVYGAVPNDYMSLYEAYSDGALLPENSALRSHFGRLARKIAGIPEPKQAGKFSLFR